MLLSIYVYMCVCMLLYTVLKVCQVNILWWQVNYIVVWQTSGGCKILIFIPDYDVYMKSRSVLWQANWLDDPERFQSNWWSRHIWESAYDIPLASSLLRRPVRPSNQWFEFHKQHIYYMGESMADCRIVYLNRYPRSWVGRFRHNLIRVIKAVGMETMTIYR